MTITIHSRVRLQLEPEEQFDAGDFNDKERVRARTIVTDGDNVWVSGKRLRNGEPTPHESTIRCRMIDLPPAVLVQMVQALSQ